MANSMIGKKGFLRNPDGWICNICNLKFDTRQLLFNHWKTTCCGDKRKKIGHMITAEKTKELWKAGKLKGHKCSEQTKQKMSAIAIENTYWQHRSKCPIVYINKKGEKLNLDSYWEKYVAERLDALNVNWYRPKIRIPYITNSNQERYYCPDFFVKDYGCFIEVKSPYISNRQNANGKIDFLKKTYDFIVWLETEEACKTFELEKKNFSGIPEKLVENFEHKVRARQIAKENKVDKRIYRGDFINLKNKRWAIIQESNIDFTKYGWVKEIARLFGIAENKAGEYIKKNFPDFYKNCYVRK